MSCGSTTCKSNTSVISAPKSFTGSAWSVLSPISWLAKIGRMHERRRQRRHLLGLDDRSLADIGISRREALEEARKPFWK